MLIWCHVPLGQWPPEVKKWQDANTKQVLLQCSGDLPFCKCVHSNSWRSIGKTASERSACHAFAMLSEDNWRFSKSAPSIKALKHSSSGMSPAGATWRKTSSQASMSVALSHYSSKTSTRSLRLDLNIFEPYRTWADVTIPQGHTWTDVTIPL